MATIFGINDDLSKILDRLFEPSYSSYSFKGKFVDPDEYDIIPKRGRVEKDIKAKEEELKQTEMRKNNVMQFYESKIKTLQLELDQLRQRLSK